MKYIPRDMSMFDAFCNPSENDAVGALKVLIVENYVTDCALRKM